MDFKAAETHQLQDMIDQHKSIFGDQHLISLIELESGMTNRNYKCTLSDGQIYIVRIPGVGSSLLVDRKAEWKNHKEIEHLKIDAKTIYFNYESGVKVSKYVENKFFSITTRERIQNVAGILKNLHQSELLFENRFNVGAMIGEYRMQAQTLSIDIGEDFYEALQKLKA